MRITGLLLVSLFFCAACTDSHDHRGKTPLVEVNGNFLYKEDLQSVLPAGLSKDDSLLFAERYIRDWAEDLLLYEKAQNNIPDNEEIEKLVGKLSPCIDYAHLSRGVGESEIGKRYQ